MKTAHENEHFRHYKSGDGFFWEPISNEAKQMHRLEKQGKLAPGEWESFFQRAHNYWSN